MFNVFIMIAVFIAGLLLGTFFFGGLLWTVERGLSSKHPSFWFLGSWLVRIAVVLGVFFLVSAGSWERLMVCFSGFFIARVIVIRYTRVGTKPGGSNEEVHNAS